MDWNGKPYYSLDYYLKKRFGCKVYKLALDGGMSCPNRDGTLGHGGCIFCSAGGSGDFAQPPGISVTMQIEKAKAQVRAKVEHPFRVIKRQFGYTKVRFRGLAKNTSQMVTLFALSNLWMARRHLLTSAGEVRL